MDSGASLLVEESVAFPAYGDQPQLDKIPEFLYNR